MIESFPNILVSDVYGSAGGVTAVHKDGKVCLRRKSSARYPGTPAQLEHLAVHRRALAAWRGLEHEVQIQWNEHAEEVEPHRPPFDGKAWISGQNLFVSAYHGFATLGQERVPEPCRFERFPGFAISKVTAVEVDGDLTLHLGVVGLDGVDVGRYWLYGQMQVTCAGCGTSSKVKWKSVLAVWPCSAGEAVMDIAQWRSVWPSVGEDTRFSMHVKFVLLDAVTGYRSQKWKGNFIVEL